MISARMRGFRDAASLISVAVLIAVWMTGCATTASTPPDPSGDPGAGAPSGGGATGPTAGERAQSAVEGMLMGAIIGGQVGPIGAAVGATTLLIYSAITGEVPLQGGRSSGPSRSEAEESAAASPAVTTPAASQPVTSPTPPTTGGVEIQVAVLSERSSAEALASRLRGKGYEARVMITRSEGKTLYRVRVGGYPDRTAAEAAAARLEKEENLKTWIPRQGG